MFTIISPSLLSADFSCLKDEIFKLEHAGADRYHLDVMDNHFVPNLTFGPPVIKALRPHTTLPFEVHLMVEKVDSIIPAIIDAGADIILIHPESTLHLHRSLSTIKSCYKKAGIVLNPMTHVDCLIYLLDLIDQVLIMTVNPGFSGQSFITSQLTKIEAIKKIIGSKPIEIAVDGGINPQTAAACKARGATVLVAGQFIFKDQNYQNNINALR